MEHEVSRRSWLGLAGVAAAGATLVACGSAPTATVTETVTAEPATPSFAPRPAITDPDAALDALRQGNERYVNAEVQHPGQHPEARILAAEGQSPFAVIVSCSDSRVPPELLVDQGIGDLFVVRVAGNVIGRSELGSIEYGVGHLHTPLVMVIGHSRCGAVQAAVDGDGAEGAIADIVELIRPAVATARQLPGEDLVDKAVRVNAAQSRDAIAASPAIAAEVAAGRVKVVAAYYDLDTGRIEIL